MADYTALADRAQSVYDRLPAESRAAFYGMVQYPIKAAAGLNAMYLAASPVQRPISKRAQTQLSRSARRSKGGAKLTAHPGYGAPGDVVMPSSVNIVSA